MKLGLDIGSTTIKCVVINDDLDVIYKSYKRHRSQVMQKLIDLLEETKNNIPYDGPIGVAISGSGAIGISEASGIPFVQEVYATKAACNALNKNIDVIVELGGEDAKILFLTGGLEVRMNGTCAGGTGAFIDQMASLLDVSVEKLNELAKGYKNIYTIASRCGVFAKSDVQPLLNQGAQKEDIAKSVLLSVVNQTISGLAQGRKIEGRVLYLGGPLTFMSELKKSFDKSLSVEGILPENSLYYVAFGAAVLSTNTSKITINSFLSKLKKCEVKSSFSSNKPLFENQKEYEIFLKRHKRDLISKADLKSYQGDVFLGVDVGSTTIKIAVIGQNEELLYSTYLKNGGDSIEKIKSFLIEIFETCPQIKIKAAASTGYGEEIVKKAFNLDFGLVETMAHLAAAKKIMPDVEFIIDIGGQDIKCFEVKNGIIDNIFLNEACSSGCGSFLETFANALGYNIHEFSKLALFAKNPVDLGSRCTVFMNSSVKEAQKNGATIEDISAGLSKSVVKNALYKVIRARSCEDLGGKIVVQGGTFLNDAVLRCFEQELQVDVVRPEISELMGAYGAALYAKENKRHGSSSIVGLNQLKNFDIKKSHTTCKGCTNSCNLTVSNFSSNRRYVSGNKCDRPVNNIETNNDFNIFSFKRDLLNKYGSVVGTVGRVGIPKVLNMYELLPFFHKLFSSLGLSVVVSDDSTQDTYLSGQTSIPSDTICYPAKLVHGHIENLIQKGVDHIFYPCMSYNLDEDLGDNHFNCPVVAYYPEVIDANLKNIKKTSLIKEYIGIHNKRDFPKKFHRLITKYYPSITFKQVKVAAEEAFEELKFYKNQIEEFGKQIIKRAQIENKQVILLAGRPYHIDTEINHGIDKMIAGFGAAIISEDAIPYKIKKQSVSVLNQWTYHSRLYNAAYYVALQKNINLVQLVSFGCGIDAITTDEVRSILELNGKIYTSLKIDEIANLGTIKIRLRSLFAAICTKDGEKLESKK